MGINEIIVFTAMLIVPTLYLVWFFIKIKDDSFEKPNTNTFIIAISALIVASVCYLFVKLKVSDNSIRYSANAVYDDFLRLSMGVYVSAFFALLYSRIAEKYNNDAHNKILNNNDAARNSIIDEINQIKEMNTFPESPAKRPDKGFFNKLSKEILNGREFTYEGDTAVTASMCLYAVNTMQSFNPNPIKVNLILEEFSAVDFGADSEKIIKYTLISKKEYESTVINLFTTLYILKSIDNKKFNITLYKKKPKSPHYHYVNLTKYSLFFSASRKQDDYYPPTFNFEESKGKFYEHFNSVMTNRITLWKNKSQKNIQNISLIDLFRFFHFDELSEKGYFDNTFSAVEDRRNTKAISEYFKKRFDERIENYQECIDYFNGKNEKA